MNCQRPLPEHGPSGGAPTGRQLEVLAYVHAYKQANEMAPSARELCTRFGWSSLNAAWDHLSRLEQLRLLTRRAKAARSLRLTESGKALAQAYLSAHPEVLHG
ncbi:hypothetical protein D7X74_24440 [Corallococcus sp. CA047B]|uniref:LexA family protein n=1 Tax=Corallococcus sp. CA047B TaxID=2316729 RepID=UPI000EA1AFD9|nr:hypothetical protein [Corallococcus sp. CA047B]RKH11974.1 hypothetical protein D7X74_24440 [Corallococcus sp. CA047B]